ncbi:MAG TPA: alpha/beta hydrolase [Chroococcales cyanobacterium]
MKKSAIQIICTVALGSLVGLQTVVPARAAESGAGDSKTTSESASTPPSGAGSASSSSSESAVQEKRQLPDWIKQYHGICYVPNSKNKAQTLDIFLPTRTKSGSSAKTLPLVIYIHGGGWEGGDKSTVPLQPLLKSDFAVASLNYRLSDQATFPAQIYDVKAAVRWLRANSRKYNLQPDHFGVWGSSAGAHLAALLGTSGGIKELEGREGNANQSSSVQAVCDFFGPSDLTTILEQAKKNEVGSATPQATEPVKKLLGKLPSQDLKLARRASPITYVSRKTPPFLIVHGDKDMLVPVQQSQELQASLKKHGVDSELVILPGEGHGRTGFSRVGINKIIAFFDRTLRSKK